MNFTNFISYLEFCEYVMRNKGLNTILINKVMSFKLYAIFYAPGLTTY
jgi:hypothetical protein